MSHPLPVAVARQSGIGLQVVDYRVDPIQVTADASGSAQLRWEEVEPGYLWRVERIVITSTSVSPQYSASVFVGRDAIPINFRDGTPVPLGFSGIAEYPVFLTVDGGSGLLVALAGMTAQSRVTGSVQYQLVQRVAG